MAKKILEDIDITSSQVGRSGIKTTNMTSVSSSLPNGSTRKNIVVDDNGEIMVGGGFQYVGYGKFSDGTGFSTTPNTETEFISIVNTDSPLEPLEPVFDNRYGLYKRQVITDYQGFLDRVNGVSGQRLTFGQQYRVTGLPSSIVTTTGVDIVVEAISETDIKLEGSLITNVIDLDGSNEVDYIELHFDKNRANGFILLRRKDKRGNDISASFDFITKTYNPIHSFVWGKENILENVVRNSQINLTNYTRKATDIIEGNKVEGYSYATKNLANTTESGIIINSTNIESMNLTIRGNVIINSNEYKSSGSSTIVISQSVVPTTIGTIIIQGNTLTGGAIKGNIFMGPGQIQGNTIVSGAIDGNTLSGNGKIELNTVYGSGKIYGGITGNTINLSGRIDRNIINQGSTIIGCIIDGGRIFANVFLSYGILDRVGIINGSISGNIFNNVTLGKSGSNGLLGECQINSSSILNNEFIGRGDSIMGIRLTGGSSFVGNSFKNINQANGGISPYFQNILFNQKRETVNARNWSPIGLNHIQDLVINEHYNSFCGRIILGGVTDVSTNGNPLNITNGPFASIPNEFTLQGSTTNKTTSNELNFAQEDTTALFGTVLVTPNVPVLHNYKIKNPGFYGIWATSGNNAHTVSIMYDKVLYAQLNHLGTNYRFSNNISDFHNKMLLLGFTYNGVSDEYEITGTPLGYEYIEFGFNHSGPLFLIGGAKGDHVYPHKSYRIYFEKTTTNPVYDIDYITDKPRHDVKLIPDSRIDVRINMIDSSSKVLSIEDMQESILPASQIKLGITKTIGQPSSFILKGGYGGDYAILSSSPYSHDKVYIKEYFNF